MKISSSMGAMLAIVAATAASAPAQIDGSKLTITGYQYVSEVQLTRTQAYFTYRADVVNVGPPTPAFTASLSVLPSSGIVLVPGKSNLHFPPVPTNTEVQSTNTFTILVDRTLPFSFNQLQWSFNAPVANAGPAQTVALGSTVTLDASGSTNPSGLGTLTYSWSFSKVPTGSQASLQNPTSVNPTFKPDALGDYVVTVAVSNGYGTDYSSVTISTTSSAPVANAGPNQTVTLGSTVFLDGSKSSDVDGVPLTYAWTFVQVPAGSQAVLNGANTVSPTFVADKVGSYVVQLVVKENGTPSAPSFVTIVTNPLNTPPIANAGRNQTVAIGATVQLDGSASTDVNGNPLTYKWSLITVPSGSKAVLSNQNIVNPTFVADVQGTYIAQLIVNDGFDDSAPATVTISTVSVLAPVANAGPPQTVQYGATVTLSGSGTDPQNLPLTYHWSLISVPNNSKATLSDPNVQNPTFVADQPGTFVAQLIVNNGTLNSAPATVTITTTISAPIANAGSNQTVGLGATVTLDGSGSSDPNKLPLTYKWSLLSVPDGSSAALSSLNTPQTTFVADVAGAYVAQLIVNNGYKDSAPSTVTITASPGNAISLSPDPLNLTSSPGTLTVSIGNPAGPNGQVVTLTVFDTTVATAPATVTIPANQTSTTATITPVGVGSTTIFGTAPNFQPGRATINVSSASLTLTLSSSNVGVTKSVTGTVTISSAPASPVTVNLTTDTPGIVTLPPSVTIQPGSQSATFTITGSSTGQVTITASATGYGSASQTLTVGLLGAITVQSNVTVGIGQSTALGVNLVTPAPAPGVTVTLTSSDTNKLTVTPSVFIKEGATSPDTPAQVTGVNYGQATVSASAQGYTGGSASVQVAANLSFNPAALTLGLNGPQSVTLMLSGTAPAGGLTVNLSSDNTGVATVPATVTISGNTNSVSVPVTPVSVGAANITASSASPGIVSGSLKVTVVRGVVISPSTLPAGVVGVAYSQSMSASGGTAPYTFSATGLPAGLSMDATGNITGTPQSAGTSQVTITATDSSAPTKLQGSIQISLVINPPLSITTNSPLPSGVQGVAYSASVAPAGGTPPYTFSATGLPAGLSMDATGKITGTPQAPGTSTVVVTLTDSTNPKQSVTANLQLTINPPLAITTTSLPTAFVNAAYTTTVTASGGTAPYSFSATGLPAGLSMDSTGKITGTPQSQGTSTVVVTVTDSTNPKQTATANLTLTVNKGLGFSTTALPYGVVGVAYNASVVATGGTTPYTYSATGLPAGLSMDATGKITGTPQSAGQSNVSFTVTDSSTPGQSATTSITITILNPLQFSTTSPLPNGVVNAGYNATVAATGGTAPYSFSATGLPAGLSMNAGGQITGTPQTAGNYTVSVTVTDSSAPQLSATASFQLAINNGLTFTTTSPLPNGAVGVAYSATVNATGGTPPYTFSATGLPAGLSMNASGQITGTPQSAGSSTVQITVTDSTSPNHLSATAPFTLNVIPPVTFTTTSLPDGTAGTAYSATVTASGGTPPYSFSATGLPAGLSMNAGGQITGTPQSAGTSSVTVTVTDSTSPNHLSATATFSLKINQPAPPPLAITTTSLPSGTAGVSYSASLQASGGTPPYSWSVIGGSLPPGLGLSASGAISGTPQTAGTYPVTFSVVDSGSPQQSQTLNTSILINPGTSGNPAITITGGTVGNGLQIPLIVSLSPGASGTVNVTISSSNPGVALAATANVAGTGSLVIPIANGTTTFSIYAQGLSSSGSATITASAPGYAQGTSQVSLANSAFVIQGPNGIGGSFIANQGTSTPITVLAYSLDGSGNFAQNQEVKGGSSQTVNIQVGSSSVGSVSPSSVTFSGGTSSLQTTFNAGSPGSTSITVSEPAPFITPAGAANMLAVTVQPVSIFAPNVTVGQNLEASATVSLQGAAPSDLPVTITSNDPSRLLFSTDPTAAGSSSITMTIRGGFSSTAPFYVYGLANSGSVTYTATASGFGTATGTVTLMKSGFVFATPSQDFSTTTQSQPTFLDIQTAMLDQSGNYLSEQALAGGMSAQVNVVSSNTNVGTITGSPVTFSGGSTDEIVEFQPKANGTTTVSIQPPTPYVAGRSLNVTVTNPNIVIDRGDTVGFNLEQEGTITLAAAPSSDLTVTLTVTNGPMSLSVNGTDSGFQSINVVIPANQNTGHFFMYGLASSGTATITANAPGYNQGTGTETLVPSGVVIYGPFGLGSNVTVTAGSSAQVNVSTVWLDPASGSVGGFQPLAGGQTLQVNVSNSNPAAGAINPPNPVTITGGTYNTTVQFTASGSASGQTTNLSIPNPPGGGYTEPSQFTQVTVSVR